MIRWLLAPLAIIFRRQPLPPLPYAGGIENCWLIEGVVDPEYIHEHNFTDQEMVLIGCHYNDKLGEYVYWCVPMNALYSGETPIPVAIAESYLIEDDDR